MRFRLRDATSAAHEQLEARMALSERCRDLDSYQMLLRDFFGIYAQLEAALAKVDWRGSDVDFERRVKATWLHADLMSLGMSDEAIEHLPRPKKLPVLRDAFDGFGVLYVLEGATLGGQIILRRIKNELGVTEQDGARFFSSYGEETGENWRRFVAALETAGRTAADIEQIERAACATFTLFLSWFDDRPSSSLSEEGRSHVC